MRRGRGAPMRYPPPSFRGRGGRGVRGGRGMRGGRGRGRGY